MNMKETNKRSFCCAIYTRVSTDQRLPMWKMKIFATIRN
jgi:hypothetical protein